MIDYSALIKQSVTMPDVLAMYGINPGSYNRIPCPIHNGVKRNFAYKEHGFVCYVCGATGDVISFVEKLFGLSFRDACRKIDQDFHLGLNIGGEMDKAKRDEAERVCAERRAERRRRDAERKRLSEAYHTALDRWCELDKAIRDGAPQTPFDDFSDSYAYALKHIDQAGAVLDEAEIKLWEFEHGRGNRASVVL